jgi:subtilisin family serine protease
MERRTRALSLTAAAAVLTVAATSGGATGAPERPVPGADEVPIDKLCGIAEPLDAIFGCVAAVDTGGTSPEQPPPSSQADAPSSSDLVRTTSVTPRYVPNLLVVTFRSGTPKKTVAAVLARGGVRLERTIAKIGVRVVRVSPERRSQALAFLRSSRWVETAQRDVLFEAFDTTPNDAHWPGQWGLQTTGLAQAWDTTRGLRNVVVAVVDTGVDAKHPDLRGALLPGVDLVNGDADPSDDHGHGTAAAGVIAARTNNKEGQAGVCWSCTILPIKALDARGFGGTSLIASAIVRSVDLGARVINLSLGGPATTEALAEAVSYAVGKGAIVVAAAGNSGTDTPFYPAAYPGVVSVAGSNPSDRLYEWSNHGERVGLAAPGCNVAPVPGGGYGNFCGTSSAAPLVAGLAALALSARPNATAQAIRRALEKSATPVAGAVRYGRVQAAATLSILGTRLPASAAVLRGKLSSAAPTRTYRRVVGSGRLTARLGFARSRTLTLSIVSPKGMRIARRSGLSPLPLAVRLRAGTYRFVVSGRNVRRADFILLLSYPPRRASQ